ncbi:MAG TPA: SDR family NAD(P)-dependent oxidoreductase, partial [Spirochaetota bacterium]
MDRGTKTIIVTGGAGFIASHIVDAYVAQGHRVVVIDDLSRGFEKNLNPNAVFYKADIRDLAAMREIFQKERPDVVNHHAAIAVVAESMRDPIPTMETNVTGTVNVLVAAGEADVKKILFASSAAVYGNPKTLPVHESDPTEPISPYGLSKLQGEEAIKCYARLFGFAYTIFRYANAYGPRQNPKGEGGVVAIF